MTKKFWRLVSAGMSRMHLDIVLKKGEECVVLDTKWKNIGTKNPSSEDLRQMFAYHQYYDAKKVALVYPDETIQKSGRFVDRNMECAVLRIPTSDSVGEWQQKIVDRIMEWIVGKFIK